MTALFELDGARIDRDGVPLIEGLTLSSSGPSAGLAGDVAGVFALFDRSAHLVAGRALVSGHPAEGAVAAGVLGVCRAELTLPESWDLGRYLTEGARLGGLSRREAADRVRALLAELDLAHLATRRLSTLTLAEKRAAGLGLSLLDSPAVLAIEDPVSGLDDRGVELVCRAVERARAGRQLLISSRALPLTGPEHALWASLDEVMVIESGAVVARGPLAALDQPGDRYLVSVTRHAAELCAHLETAGIGVTQTGERARLVVSLPDASTTDVIVEAALAVQAPIVELVPLSAAR
ncbi:MAG: hypothetical protein IT377_26860 [Polyangiaceae bacterium]|nr:hypothetical protein [Polyangiaceae bacterium]